jgi:hypothetical protein
LGDYAEKCPRSAGAANRCTDESSQRLGKGSQFVVGLPPHVEEDSVFGRERLDVDDGVVRFLVEACHPSPVVSLSGLDVHWGERCHATRVWQWVRSRPDGASWDAVEAEH